METVDCPYCGRVNKYDESSHIDYNEHECMGCGKSFLVRVKAEVEIRFYGEKLDE